MQNMRMRWMPWVLLGAAACGGENNNDLPRNVGVSQARLERFDSCEALENYIEDAAVLDMKSQIEQSKVGMARGGGFAVDDVAEAAPSTDATAGAAGPDNYTTTNTQVAGVDEADFVKNDGTRIFVLSGQKLYALQSWPAASLSRKSALDIEGYPSEMFLQAEKNRVVIFSQVYDASIQPVGGNGGGWSGAEPGIAVDFAPCSALDCGYYRSNTVKVTTVDVSDLSEPKVVDQVYFPGQYLNSRRIGSSVRLVLSDSLRWPSTLRWYPDSGASDTPTSNDQANPSQSTKDWERAMDRLKVENEQAIRAQTLDQWFPSAKRTLADGTTETLGYDCKDFHKSTAPARLGLVTVASLDLDSPAQAPGRTTLVAQADQVYANTESLYVASSHWWWWPEPGQTDYTYLHKFDIRQAGEAPYLGSGGVDGTLLNAFSMDEFEGILRVATTLNRRVKNNTDDWGSLVSTSRVTTFRTTEGEIAELGKSPELAEGERIYSARFVGKKGYMVTFRQVDPLFTFDLSDPANPHKVGELKIPGFSSYIHPVGDTHLLTIGSDVGETGGGTRAIKLSLFDVSDLANPREAFMHRIGTGSSYSEAQYQHKAFNYFAEKGLLAIPVSDWNSSGSWSGFRSELLVFGVSTSTGFTTKGSLGVTDLYVSHRYMPWTWYWMPEVRRSVMADDFVYAISDAGVRVANVNQLSTPVATSLFNPYGQVD